MYVCIYIYIMYVIMYVFFLKKNQLVLWYAYIYIYTYADAIPTDFFSC